MEVVALVVAVASAVAAREAVMEGWGAVTMVAVAKARRWRAT